MAASGFYTNRLRHCNVLTSLHDARFDVTSDEPVLWPEIPIPRRAIHREFRHHTDDALLIKESHVVVRPR